MLVRQRPGTASGVVFVMIEDESGIANLVVWPQVFESNRHTVMGARLLGVWGRVQREGLVIHLVAEELHDWSEMLDQIALAERLDPPVARADEVGTGAGDHRLIAPEARATHVRAAAPVLKIASRDFR
jgi:error-prone DNA polymerase